MNKKENAVQTIVLCGLFIALGVLTPQIFHLFGAAAGQTFLPMHIPVLIAGLCVSPLCGAISGIFSPMLSCIITSMPSPIKMPFMCVELFVYGLVSGFAMKLFSGHIKNYTVRVYTSLITAQICGRAANILCTAFGVYVLGLRNPAVSMKAALISVPTGLIGIAIQLIFIPPVAVVLNKYVTIGKKSYARKIQI